MPLERVPFWRELATSSTIGSARARVPIRSPPDSRVDRIVARCPILRSETAVYPAALLLCGTLPPLACLVLHLHEAPIRDVACFPHYQERDGNSAPDVAPRRQRRWSVNRRKPNAAGAQERAMPDARTLQHPERQVWPISTERLALPEPPVQPIRAVAQGDSQFVVQTPLLAAPSSASNHVRLFIARSFYSIPLFCLNVFTTLRLINDAVCLSYLRNNQVPT